MRAKEMNIQIESEVIEAFREVHGEKYLEKDMIAFLHFRQGYLSLRLRPTQNTKNKSLPENSVTITESQWEEARNLWDTDKRVGQNLNNIKDFLFGKEEM